MHMAKFKSRAHTSRETWPPPRKYSPGRHIFLGGGAYFLLHREQFKKFIINYTGPPLLTSNQNLRHLKQQPHDDIYLFRFSKKFRSKFDTNQQLYQRNSAEIISRIVKDTNKQSQKDW